jgi:hypothetical protein
MIFPMFFSEGFFKNVDDGYVWLAGLAFKGASVLRVAFCVLRFAFCVLRQYRPTLNAQPHLGAATVTSAGRSTRSAIR